MKKLLSLLLCLTMALSLSLNSFATVPADNNDEYLYDYAGLISTTDEERLRDELKELSLTSGWDVAAVLIDDNMGLSSAAYADEFYEQNGFADDGILMLINMDDREVWLSTCGEAITYFTDGIIDDMTLELVEPLADGNYVEAVSLYLLLAEEVMTAPAQGHTQSMEPKPSPVQPSPKSKLAETAGIAAVVAAITGGIVALVMALMHKSLPNKTQNTIHYVSGGRVHLNINRDIFVNSTLRKTKIQQNPPSSGGSHSHSSVHRTSGRSHGGGGRKF